MTGGNRTRLEKASRELLELSQSNRDAQTVSLTLLTTMQLLYVVLQDLILRPEVNSEESK